MVTTYCGHFHINVNRPLKSFNKEDGKTKTSEDGHTETIDQTIILLELDMSFPVTRTVLVIYCVGRLL